MQVQRNNAYKPDIIFETVTCSVCWIEEKSVQDSETLYQKTSIQIPTKNIGVGAAKKLKYSVDTSTLVEWIELLKKQNPNEIYNYKYINDLLQLEFNGNAVAFSKNLEFEKVFLLPNAEETFNINLPLVYNELLKNIFSNFIGSSCEIPEIKIKVTFEDVQGVKYTENIKLSVNPQLVIEEQNGNGEATYIITMN